MPGELRALLTALALPPLLPLMLLALGLLLALTQRHRRKGLWLAGFSWAALWLVSCYAVSMTLSTTLLASYPALTTEQVRTSGAQAIIVLGGGILRTAPEYEGMLPPNSYTAPRLNYGARLAKATGLPLGYTGGVGHGAAPGSPPEAGHMAAFSEALLGVPMRWIEVQSRDTMENGYYMAQILRRDGIRRVALVTHELHMERSIYAFERAGLEVIPAPTAHLLQVERGLVEWLPSASGLQWSRLVLREWLGLWVARWQARL